MPNKNNLIDCKHGDYIKQVQGILYGLLSWGDFDHVCEYIGNTKDINWYIYEIEKSIPQNTSTNKEIKEFIRSLNSHIHKDYDREHCGIAFVDSIDEPSILKVFNPKLLKSICNIYGSSPIHGWVVSRQKPVDLNTFDEINTGSSQNNIDFPKAKRTLDARRTGCPLPIINTCRALESLHGGELLEIMTIEPGAVKDVSIICDRTGDRMISTYQTHNGYSIFVEKIESKHKNT